MSNLKQRLHEERKARLARMNRAADKLRQIQLEQERKEQERLAEEKRRIAEEQERIRREREANAITQEWNRMSNLLQMYLLENTKGMTPRERVRQIVEEICEHHGVSMNEMESPRRNSHIVNARHHLFWRLYKETNWSLPHIGKFVGNKDHTTVLHGVRRIETMLKEARNEAQSGAGISAEDRRGTGMHIRRCHEDFERDVRDVLALFGSPD